MILRLVTGSYNELERPWPFYGVRLTWFHWTHNLRVYFGFGRSRRGWWRPVFRTMPYTLGRSIELRRTPDPFPERRLMK